HQEFVDVGLQRHLASHVRDFMAVVTLGVVSGAKTNALPVPELNVIFRAEAAKPQGAERFARHLVIGIESTNLKLVARGWKTDQGEGGNPGKSQRAELHLKGRYKSRRYKRNLYGTTDGVPSATRPETHPIRLRFPPIGGKLVSFDYGQELALHQ